MRATRSCLSLLLAAAALLAACTPARSSPDAVASPTQRPVLTLADIDAEPIERREESVAFAFDHRTASELVAELPADVDFEAHALVCVFLGPRQTTGWSLDLRSASLTDDVLSIRARETSPRAGTRPKVTYPADCGLLSRAALPPGRLTVRADDTITDEFIADTVIVVPAPSSSP